jgi:hypothetical protein
MIDWLLCLYYPKNRASAYIRHGQRAENALFIDFARPKYGTKMASVTISFDNTLSHILLKALAVLLGGYWLCIDHELCRK